MAGIEDEDYDIRDLGDDMSDSPWERHHSGPSLHDELVEEGQQRRRLTESKARSLYKSLGVEPPGGAIYPDDFKVKDDHLYVKNKQGELIQLTHKRNPSRFVGWEAIRQRLSASERDRLGFIKPKLNPDKVAKLQNTLQKLPTDNQMQNMEPEVLNQTADRIINAIEAKATEEEEAEPTEEEETALKTMHDPPLLMRELLALDRLLRTINGELLNNLTKLTELEEHIEKEKEKLAEADDANLGPEIKERIKQRLKDLEIQRSSRLEVVTTNRDQLRTQVNRIRETIEKILYEDATLAERIRTLFREQGVTLASVITALGFAISTLVMAITGGGGGQIPVPPSPSPPPDKSWVKKKQLDHLASLLKKISQ